MKTAIAYFGSRLRLSACAVTSLLLVTVTVQGADRKKSQIAETNTLGNLDYITLSKRTPGTAASTNSRNMTVSNFVNLLPSVPTFSNVTETAGRSIATNAHTLFVRVDGDDSTGKRGRRDKAWRNIVAAATNSQPGDTILVGPGTFNLTFTNDFEGGLNTLVLSNNVSLIGAGIDQTIIQFDNDWAGSGGPVGIAPRDNCLLKDFTIRGTRNTAKQVPVAIDYVTAITEPDLTVKPSLAATNVTLDGLRIIADSDGLVVRHTNKCEVLVKNCVFENAWDCVVVSSNSNHRVEFVGCVFRAKWPSTSTGASTAKQSRCINAEQGTIRLLSCYLEAVNAPNETIALRTAGANAVLEAYNCAFNVSSTNGYTADATNGGGTLKIFGTGCDINKLFGSVSVNGNTNRFNGPVQINGTVASTLLRVNTNTFMVTNNAVGVGKVPTPGTQFEVSGNAIFSSDATISGTIIASASGISIGSAGSISDASGVMEFFLADHANFFGALYDDVIKIGGGSDIQKITTATGTLDFPNTSAQQHSDLSIALTGAASGDSVQLGVPVASLLANTCYTAFASNDVVYVRFNNYSSSAKDPASGSFRVTLTKF